MQCREFFQCMYSVVGHLSEKRKGAFEFFHSTFQSIECLLLIYLPCMGPDAEVVRISPIHFQARLHMFNGPLSGTIQVSRYQKANLDLTEARDSEWQWHQLGHMQVYTSLQTDNHASTPPLIFLPAGCPSCRPANNV